MDLIWPKHFPCGHNKLELQGYTFLALGGFSVKIRTILNNQMQKYSENSQNMALKWPKHGPHMVLLIGSS